MRGFKSNKQAHRFKGKKGRDDYERARRERDARKQQKRDAA